MEFITQSATETQETGKRFANALIEGQQDTLTAALVGDLGSGKTTFVQGFAKGLGINQQIISPTFILMRMYPVPKGFLRFKSFYHADLYRIAENLHEEVRNLGLLDMWGREGNIVLIEWGEKVKELLPKGSYWVEFKNLGVEARKISITDII